MITSSDQLQVQRRNGIDHQHSHIKLKEADFLSNIYKFLRANNLIQKCQVIIQTNNQYTDTQLEMKDYQEQQTSSRQFQYSKILDYLCYGFSQTEIFSQDKKSYINQPKKLHLHKKEGRSPITEKNIFVSFLMYMQ